MGPDCIYTLGGGAILMGTIATMVVCTCPILQFDTSNKVDYIGIAKFGTLQTEGQQQTTKMIMTMTMILYRTVSI